ncbi:MAG: hypothetical protein KDA37_05880 [Planctomycetales bacterium]|nr:hypothetical protein [Planctomycetales bacterium]
MAFYANEHNTRLPHSALRRRTPDKAYLGAGKSVPAELDKARQIAREARAAANRAQTCAACC